MKMATLCNSRYASIQAAARHGSLALLVIAVLPSFIQPSFSQITPRELQGRSYSVYSLKKVGGDKVEASAEIFDVFGKPALSKGQLMFGSALQFGKNGVGKEGEWQLVRDGLVYTPRTERIRGMDLAIDGKIVDQASFDFQAFRKSSSVIRFGDEYAVNLFGARVISDRIVPSHPTATYIAEDGRRLRGRLIRQTTVNGKIAFEETILPVSESVPVPESLYALKQKANGGDAKAQSKLGWLYLQGEGVKKNDEEALKWFQLAAAQHNAYAEYCLGFMYENGIGLRQDRARSVEFFKRAAEGGFAQAQFKMGQICEAGKWVVQDDIEAYKWFRLAVGGGETNAVRFREATVSRLSAQQLDEGQRRVNEFRPR